MVTLVAASFAGSSPATPPPSPPSLALLSGVPGSARTHLLFARGGSHAKWTVAATLEHPPGAIVRGVVLPGTRTVLAVADTVPAREPSWAASLVRLEPGAQPRVLADRVYHATRPLLLGSRVFVQRGEPGEQPVGANGRLAMRVDALRIDEIEPSSGAARTVHAWKGYETHLAGALGNELVVYRVGPAGADLVAVDADKGSVRVVVPSWPAAARELSIDRASGALVLQQRSNAPDRHLSVERVDLATGARQQVATSAHADMVPHVWPGGGVVFNPEGAREPALLGSNVTLRLGATSGLLWVQAVSTDGAWVGALRMPQNGLPVAVAVRAADGVSATVGLPAGERVEIAGFVGEAGAGSGSGSGSGMGSGSGSGSGGAP
jgi:hypothetical protein